MNEPGMLAIKAINQAVARERYGEGGKALQGSPPGETGRGSDEYNRKSVVIFQKGKKKDLITAVFRAPAAASPAVTCRHISLATGHMFWACLLSFL